MSREQSSHLPNGNQDYQGAIDRALARPLDPDSIDSFAEDVLDEVIGVVDQVVGAYQAEPTIGFDTQKAFETAALNYLGLTNIEVVLDSLADKTTEIDSLDRIIAGAEQTNHVIVPPDHRELPFELGAGGQAPSQLVSRLKTTLFMLTHEFGVELSDDPTQFHLTSAALHPNMRRRSSYFLLEAPVLERSLLICDEVGNASYVFDNAILPSLGLTPAELAKLHKPEINQLLDEHPDMGQRFEYSNRFVSNMLQALANPGDQTKRDIRSVNLSPKPEPTPAEYLSEGALTKKLGVYSLNLGKAILAVKSNPEFGPTRQMIFGSHCVTGFSPKQQGLLTYELWAMGSLRPKAPADYMTLSKLAKKIEVSYVVADQALTELDASGDLGSTDIWRFPFTTTAGLAPEQQGKITQQLWAKGHLYEQAPEGYLAFRGLRTKLGVSKESLVGAITHLEADDRFGSIRTWKFVSNATTGYSPAQQGMIIHELWATGQLPQDAPADYLSGQGLADKLAVSRHLIAKAIKRLRLVDELQAVTNWKFISNDIEGYSPKEQGLITHELWSTGNLDKPAPADYLSINGLAVKLGVAHTTVAKSYARLRQAGEMQTVQKMRLNTIQTPGFTPQDQGLITHELWSSGVLRKDAPSDL